MAGAAFEVRIDSNELRQLQERLDRLAVSFRPAGLGGMLEGLAAEVETQTKRRISQEKTSPNGEKWPEWDPDSRYAKTRHRNQGLLVGEGELLESIEHAVSGGVAEIGTNRIYGPLHQFGGTPDMAPGPAAVRARAFLGLSDGDVRELDGVLSDWMGGLIEEALA